MEIQKAMLATIATMDAAGMPYKKRIKAFRRQCMYAALRKHGGDVKQAADEMGIVADTIHREIRQAAKERIADGTL